MHCKPNNILPTVVHPTKHCVNHTFSNNVVPHVHPTHTTTVNHTNYQHQHHFPHTHSAVNEVTHQHFAAGPGPAPGPFGAGVGPAPAPGPFGAGPYGPGPFRR